MDRKSARMLQPGDSVDVKLELDGDAGWYSARVTRVPTVRDVGLTKVIDVHVTLLNGKRFTLSPLSVRKPRN